MKYYFFDTLSFPNVTLKRVFSRGKDRAAAIAALVNAYGIKDATILEVECVFVDDDYFWKGVRMDTTGMPELPPVDGREEEFMMG